MKSWLIWKDPDAGKDWGQEEKGMTEDEMVGWHHRPNGHGFGWTPGVGDGQGGLACCSSWGLKELDTTERLNWTELNLPLCLSLNSSCDETYRTWASLSPETGYVISMKRQWIQVPVWVLAGLKSQSELCGYSWPEIQMITWDLLLASEVVVGGQSCETEPLTCRVCTELENCLVWGKNFYSCE